MKKLWKFIPTHILVPYGCGIVFQFLTNTNLRVFSISALVLILLVVLKIYKKAFFLCYPIVFVLGMLAVFIKTHPSNYYQNFVKNNSTVTVSISEVLKSNPYQYRYYAKVIKVDSFYSQGKILLVVAKDVVKESLQINDEIAVKSNFKSIRKPVNFYGFDYQFYLRTKNVKEQLSVKKGNWVLVSNGNSSIKNKFSNFRNKLITSLEKYLKNKDVLAITEAMLLGNRKDVSKKIQQEYADAGVIHILAISGLHIGILVLLLNFLFSPLLFLPHGKVWKLFFMILSLWCFAVLAGLSASVVRSVTMFSFMALGIVMGNKTTVLYSLVTSALLLLLIQPFYLFDVGFQMSYLAVFFIVLLQPLLYGLWSPKYIILNYFWKLTTVSLAAQLGILPVSLFYFHQFPSLFILTNLVVIPFVGVLLTFGFLILILATVDWLPIWLLKGYNFFIISLNQFIRFISEQEGFVMKGISFSNLKMMISYAVIIGFVVLLKFKKIKSSYFLLIAIIALQVVSIYEKIDSKAINELFIFHKYKESAILIVKEGNGVFYSSNLSKTKRILEDYCIESEIEIIEINKKVDDLFLFNKNKILVIDSLGIYAIENFKNEIVLLRGSPKINLERLLLKLQPKLIIADGSNYKNYVNTWRKTCNEYGVLFHDTAKKGAFVLK